MTPAIKYAIPYYHVTKAVFEDIRAEELNWPRVPKPSGIGNGLKYQYHCLDVQVIDSWN